jgi:hypothetical protein
MTGPWAFAVFILPTLLTRLALEVRSRAAKRRYAR